MSNQYYKKASLAGVDISALSIESLRALARKLLDGKISGLCFSPYVDGQGPGSIIREAQIRERLEIIAPHVHWVRSFSCTDGHELIPRIAAEMSLKTMVGVWLDDDLERNEKELANAIDVAMSGHADILAVGNEVLLRGDLSEDQLLDYIVRIKQAVPNVDVSYVDAYFQLVDHPRVTEACDVLLANCYPFWEGYPAEHALLYMKDMYRRTVAVANGKKVIISETGWPNIGTATHGAAASFEIAIKYFIDAYQWAEEDGIDIFYFSAFDEIWKVDSEGDVGAYWGLWDKNGKPKYF
jgi:exo-beta-1,3-glucanase (GH17 family)